MSASHPVSMTRLLFGVRLLALWPECTARDGHSPGFPYLILEGCRAVVSSAFRVILAVPQSLLTPSWGVRPLPEANAPGAVTGSLGWEVQPH